MLSTETVLLQQINDFQHWLQCFHFGTEKWVQCFPFGTEQWVQCFRVGTEKIAANLGCLMPSRKFNGIVNRDAICD